MCHMRKWVVVLIAGVVVGAGVASATSPPGVVGSISDQQDHVRYVAARGADSTVVYAVRNGQVRARIKIDGAWGVPAVTSSGLAGGLTADGRTLVLAEVADPGLRTKSRFLELSTTPLAVRTMLELKGDFSFDVLSPNGRWLYLIQHVPSSDLAYRVRAYDLARARLLRGAIVAKGESQTMSGYPVARATSGSGSWVYTLYRRASGEPFVHALNAAQRYAVCVDLPAEANANQLRLSSDGRRLLVRLNGAVVATIDTRSFKVT
jgi:hypothetical protein